MGSKHFCEYDLCAYCEDNTTIEPNKSCDYRLRHSLCIAICTDQVSKKNRSCSSPHCIYLARQDAIAKETKNWEFLRERGRLRREKIRDGKQSKSMLEDRCDDSPQECSQKPKSCQDEKLNDWRDREPCEQMPHPTRLVTADLNSANKHSELQHIPSFVKDNMPFRGWNYDKSDYDNSKTRYTAPLRDSQSLLYRHWSRAGKEPWADGHLYFGLAKMRRGGKPQLMYLWEASSWIILWAYS